MCEHVCFYKRSGIGPKFKLKQVILKGSELPYVYLELKQQYLPTSMVEQVEQSAGDTVQSC